MLTRSHIRRIGFRITDYLTWADEEVNGLREREEQKEVLVDKVLIPERSSLVAEKVVSYRKPLGHLLNTPRV